LSAHEKVVFTGSHADLSGSLQLPDRHPIGSVVLAHCFTCSKSYKVVRYLADGIERAGYAVLRFDFTGLGESEGDFGQTSVTTNVEDLEGAAQYMRQRGFGPCAMVGHSLGGAATLLAAGRLPHVRAFAVVASPSNAGHLRRVFTENDVETALTTGRVRVQIAGRPFDISAEFFRDLERHGTLDHITELGRPLLVVHPAADRIVEIEEGEKIFAAARQPRWFAAIPNADHLLTRPEHGESAAGIIVEFLRAVLT
jgi:putative redox protein